MKLRDIATLVSAEILTGDMKLDMDVRCAFSADLMSDVLAYAQPGALLVTGLVNQYVVRTADMADIAAILFVRGKRPGPEAIAMAKELEIPLMVANASLFEVSGCLFQSGMNSCEVRR